LNINAIALVLDHSDFDITPSCGKLQLSLPYAGGSRCLEKSILSI
jgi:hypothetical protein